MGVLEDLKRLSAAEEFFHYFGVEYEPSVLHVARLHIMKRMGEYFAQQATLPATEDEVRTNCTSFLRQAYQDFRTRTPIEVRVFKVHKDAQRAQRKKPTLVSLTPLASGPGKN